MIEMNRPGRERLFYSVCAAVLLIVMGIGFLPFYANGKAYGGHDLPRPIYTLTILHGVGMTAWALLFQLQTSLIARGCRHCHKLLGQASALLALLLVFLGLRMAIASTLIAPPDLRISGLLPGQFMIVPIFNILAFAGFTFIGLSLRKHPQAHRSLMLLSTLAIMSAAISRIDVVTAFYEGTFWQRLFGPFMGMLVLGALFMGANLLLNRKLDRSYALGYAVLVTGSALTIALATSQAWQSLSLLMLE